MKKALTPPPQKKMLGMVGNPLKMLTIVINPLKLLKMVCTPLKTRDLPPLEVFDTFP